MFLKICVYAYNTHPNTSNLSKNKGFRVDFQTKKHILRKFVFFWNALFQSVNWYLCDKNSLNVMIIPITTRKIKSVKVSLFVYPPKYGYFELSVFDYELLCLNGARSWTSLQFVQVRTSPTSHAATTFWSRSFVASLSTRYWQVTTLYRVLHAQLWGCPLSYHRVEHCFFCNSTVEKIAQRVKYHPINRFGKSNKNGSPTQLQVTSVFKLHPLHLWAVYIEF